jgi:hypothetical protein
MKLSVIPSVKETFNAPVNLQGSNYQLQSVVRSPGDKIACSIDHADSAWITWSGNSYSSCVLEQCSSNYHRGDNDCLANSQSCSVDHGGGTQVWAADHWGTCIVDNCGAGYHVNPNQLSCDPDVITCSADHSTAATQAWTGSEYGTCSPVSCVANFHIESNSCLSNSKSCSFAVNNATGCSGAWNQPTNNYKYTLGGSLAAVSCNVPYMVVPAGATLTISVSGSNTIGGSGGYNSANNASGYGLNSQWHIVGNCPGGAPILGWNNANWVCVAQGGNFVNNTGAPATAYLCTNDSDRGNNSGALGLSFSFFGP